MKGSVSVENIVGADEVYSLDTWRAAVVEFIGTFAFVFLAVGTVIGTSIVFGGDGAAALTLIGVGSGIALAIAIWATAHISGGHINPAVTIAAFVTGRIKFVKGGLYVIGPVAGAICAVFLLKALVPDFQEGDLGAHALSSAMQNESIWLSFGVEALLTAFLVFVVFAVAVDRRGPGNIAPLAIGLVFMLDHFIGVPLTGASMNPARTFGSAFAADLWDDQWIYWVGPIAGGVAAAVIYQLLFTDHTMEEAAA